MDNDGRGDRSAQQQPRHSFDAAVLRMVEQIPRGQLATYGQIAELIGA